MVNVILTTNPLDLSSYEKFDNVTDIEALLREKLTRWPETARIYHERIAVENDVTPLDDAGIERLLQLEGTIWVVVYPADPITAIVVAIAAAALVVAAFFLLMPKLPNPNGDASPNNGLSNRVNSARPTKRIPDIYGTVLAVPDLIAVPYKKFINNFEVEIAYMCLGRGHYDIKAVYDGDTPIAQIAGSAVAFYGPNTSPNFGTPQALIGTPIGEPVLSTIKSNEVNGQSLKAPNANQVKGDDNIRFVYPDVIQRTGSDIDFTKYFESGDELTVARAAFSGSMGTATISQLCRFTSSGEIEFDTFNPSSMFSAGQYVTVTNGGYAGEVGIGGILFVDLSGTYLIGSVTSSKIILSSPALVNSDWNDIDEFDDNRTNYRASTVAIATSTSGINLGGTYTVLSVTSSSITLSNPGLVNSSWNNLVDLDGGATDYASPVLSTSAERWVGPFIADLPEADRLLLNFAAEGGLYQISDKGNEWFLKVSLEAEVTPIDDTDIPTGPAQIFPVTMGVDNFAKNPPGTKEPIRVSLEVVPTFVGRSMVRVRRTTPRDDDYDGQLIDEIKWRDMYVQAPVAMQNFGNITTVHSRTYATSGASSIKERKLTCEVTRKVPQRNLDNTFGPALIPTNSAADIICAAALDPYVGNRVVSELDVDNIYNTIEDVKEYFGFDEAGEFCYTFDDDNISFEETIQTIANAVFCNAFRQGSKIKLKFEKETNDSVILFNHRNKIPGTETRTITFGGVNDYDGVEYEYVDPYDSSVKTIYIPTDRSAINPKKVQSTGQRNFKQAHVAAWRVYNKIKYQHTTAEFDATSVADILLVNDRVLATDGTRVDSIEGEVEGQEGLTLELSQPFEPEVGVNYTIFVQHVNGTVEAIEIVADPSDPYKVVLAEPPSHALSVDPDNYARATYWITGDTDTGSNVFLVTEKTPGERLTTKLQVVNYDARYYQNDKDFA